MSHVSNRALGSCLVYSPTLNIETKLSSDTSVHFQLTTHCYVAEDGNLHNHRVETWNLTKKDLVFVKSCSSTNTRNCHFLWKPNKTVIRGKLREQAWISRYIEVHLSDPLLWSPYLGPRANLTVYFNWGVLFRWINIYFSRRFCNYESKKTQTLILNTSTNAVSKIGLCRNRRDMDEGTSAPISQKILLLVFRWIIYEGSYILLIYYLFNDANQWFR